MKHFLIILGLGAMFLLGVVAAQNIEPKTPFNTGATSTLNTETEGIIRNRAVPRSASDENATAITENTQNSSETKQQTPSNTPKLPLPPGALLEAWKILKNRDITAAKAAFEKIEPQNQATLLYRGMLAAFLNDAVGAKDLLIRSIEAGSEPKLTAAAQKILTVYRDFELARDAKTEYLQTLLATSLNELGEHGLAIELSLNALKKNKDYRDTWIVLGHAQLNEGLWNEAEESLSRATELDAGHPASYFFRGIARQNLGKPLEAIPDFETALSLGFNPKILPKFELAETWFSLKEFEKAYPLYRETVMTDPSDLNRFIRPMALAINHVKKPQDALELAQKAFLTHPDSAISFNLLGWAEIAVGNFDEAQRHLEEALLKEPTMPAAHLNLGQLAQRRGNNEEALRRYRMAEELALRFSDPSIGNTARLRYNSLQQKITALPVPAPAQTPIEKPAANEPQSKKIIPSLSLE